MDDVSVIHVIQPLTFIPNAVQAAYFAGVNYTLPDNTPVMNAGWDLQVVF